MTTDISTPTKEKLLKLEHANKLRRQRMHAKKLASEEFALDTPEWQEAYDIYLTIMREEDTNG